MLYALPGQIQYGAPGPAFADVHQSLPSVEETRVRVTPMGRLEVDVTRVPLLGKHTHWDSYIEFKDAQVFRESMVCNAVAHLLRR
jgi:hypothetical protein